ncbi:SDR family oxidoreductase [Bosea sp. CS1GBMeth4]|uniref:SDR family NAD(P)-dependent oxidoreductase n=1 Tax=Bosea sp. CS1GBMeth4 TaxID=1892849 RepID=UPI001648C08A|nr:SDR family oxidoreductase [Bosea sp. CS1GBMeth4]
MDLGLQGRIALVTGGSRGIGKQTALLLATEGVRLALAARGEETLAEAAASIREAGGEVITIQADLRSPAESARVVAETISSYGRLDILVANAGGSIGERDFAAASDADWEETFRFNVGHAVAALRAATPALARSEIGNAVFVASISGRAPASRGAQYAAAKAGLIHAARSLAWELGPHGIRVNAVSPGSTLFPGGGWERLRAERPEEFAKFEAEDFPARRLATVREIADAIAFVVSPRASGINAADIQVDGGQRRPSLR